jgi:hypothetical protein
VESPILHAQKSAERPCWLPRRHKKRSKWTKDDHSGAATSPIQTTELMETVQGLKESSNKGFGGDNGSNGNRNGRSVESFFPPWKIFPTI